ncbi:MAG: class I SAM-dependent methyltransferase [Rhodospirillales bacterium]|nr:class I SAM-dependent methyltransferase [Rhodospirillales bacterium]
MPHNEQDPTTEQRGWASSDSLDFFARERRAPDDLYPSEKSFLPDAVGRASNVLDVGCACGGFASIMRAFNPSIRYTGIDIVPEMLARAGRETFGDTFAAAAGHELPFKDRAFDLVHCSGAVHLNSRYQPLIADMWRVTDGEALFDMRLTEGPSLQGSFRIDFADTGEGGILPYHVVNLEEARALIDSLPDAPARVRLAGYRHPASGNANLPEATPVIMAVLLLQRSSPETGWDIHIES